MQWTFVVESGPQGDESEAAPSTYFVLPDARCEPVGDGRVDGGWCFEHHAVFCFDGSFADVDTILAHRPGQLRRRRDHPGIIVESFLHLDSNVKEEPTFPSGFCSP